MSQIIRIKYKIFILYYGTKYICFIQDTNAVTMKALLSSVGVTHKNNFVMNSITTERLAGEELGALCRLINKTTNQVLTINVEYNQLEPLLNNYNRSDTQICFKYYSYVTWVFNMN